MSSKRRLDNELTQWFPSRLADLWTQGQSVWQRPLADIPDRALEDLAQQLTSWSVKPGGTEGYKKAEVTGGGVALIRARKALDEALAAQGLKASGYRLLGYNSPFILPWRQTHELQALLR